MGSARKFGRVVVVVAFRSLEVIGDLLDDFWDI